MKMNNLNSLGELDEELPGEFNAIQGQRSHNMGEFRKALTLCAVEDLKKDGSWGIGEEDIDLIHQYIVFICANSPKLPRNFVPSRAQVERLLLY